MCVQHDFYPFPVVFTPKVSVNHKVSFASVWQSPGAGRASLLHPPGVGLLTPARVALLPG